MTASQLATAIILTAAAITVTATIFNRSTKQLIGETMGALQDAVDQITTQLDKAKTELTTQIAALEAQVASGETPDLEPLKAAAQALDDLVVDVPTEEPTEEPPA